MNIGPIFWVSMLAYSSIWIGRQPREPIYYGVAFEAGAGLLHLLALRDLALLVLCAFTLARCVMDFFRSWRSRHDKAESARSTTV